MPRLIWVFAGRTLILLVLSCRGAFHCCPLLSVKTCLQGFRQGMTQIGLLTYWHWLESWNLGLICGFVVRIWHKQIFPWRASTMYSKLYGSRVLSFSEIDNLTCSRIFESYAFIFRFPCTEYLKLKLCFVYSILFLEIKLFYLTIYQRLNFFVDKKWISCILHEMLIPVNPLMHRVP